MPDYKNAKIYKLWSPEGDDIYIGSTTKLLSARKAQHKYDKDKLECKSRILYENYNDIRIELLECFPCENKDELNKKEGEYIRNNDCVNKNIPGRTAKEWYEDNKEKVLEYQIDYRLNNQDKIKERKSIKIMCDCGEEINKDDKARHYKTKKHIDKLNQTFKEPKEVLNCDCGGTYQLYRKLRHERTKTHQDYLTR
tara:strand:+ start:95 stop:682 length:588 start_codon:yes stop_codon:yes gene_type:complete